MAVEAMPGTSSRFCFCWAMMLAMAASVAARGQELDPYGGWRDVRGEATGSFYLQQIGGRHMLVTPAGHGFVALGINHLSVISQPGPNETDLFSQRYGSDWHRFARHLLQQFDDWALNTVDDSVELLTQQRPYFAAQTFARTAKYFGRPGQRNPYDFPDVFDPAVQRQLADRVKVFCEQHRDNPRLIAYYWTDTPTWDIRKTRRFRGTDWVSEIRRLPAGASGKRHYAEFLRAQYGDIADLRRAYNLDLESFEQLAAIDYDSLDLTRYEVERDDALFLGLIAKTYYDLLAENTRRHDSKHMIFGEKYLLGDIPPQVLRAALPHLDAIAIQPGDGYIPIYTPGDRFPTAEITALAESTGKPIMICDHQISFATDRYPKSIWPYYQRDSEQEAATATERFLIEAFQHPFIIGYMRCQYIDRFSKRRNASKLGLLRDDGRPYQRMVEATRRGSLAVQQMVRNQILHDDSSKGQAK